MLKLLLLLVFCAGVAFIGYLAQQYDFPITAEFRGYLIETSGARVLVVLIFMFMVFYALIRIISWIRNTPKRLMGRRRHENEQRGYRDIMHGFSALAAGSNSRAAKFAEKADKALPGQPMVKLLQAQVAVATNNKTDAEKYYKELSLTEEGKFVGFRGLISQSINGGQPQRALQIADDLLRENPKSAWLNEALVDLAFRTQDWEKLERYLKKAEANKALSKAALKDRFAVYYYMKAKIARADGRIQDAEWLGERSLKYKADFLPAAIFLSDLYVEEEKYKQAKKLIEAVWPRYPHPQLARSYEAALLNTGTRDKAKKVKKLYEKNTDDVGSAIFYAKVLIEERHSEEAREIISRAMRLHETKTLCNLMAEIDDKISWQNRAEQSGEDKSWYCRVTGAKYADWQPYSESGELDTIIWGFAPQTPKTVLADDNFLFIN